MNPLPFTAMTANEISKLKTWEARKIESAKTTLACLLDWKEKGIIDGKKYPPKTFFFDISLALLVLESVGVTTEKQRPAIIKLLLNDCPPNYVQ